jgi:hypothetical protein
MTAYSQNGWTANDRGVIGSYSLPGGKVAVRAGDVSVVLLWVANRFHEQVERLEWPGNWGYAERPIRGSATVLSNHASGTAIDLNAPRHPLGVRGTFAPSQVAAIHRILALCGGVVRWGGDYSGRVDEMHFEINAGAAAVRAVADRIRGAASPPPPPPPPTSRPREDDDMYIKYQAVKDGPIQTGLLSGGVFIPLSPGEAGSADVNINKFGAIAQWVERTTWDALVARSHS